MIRSAEAYDISKLFNIDSTIVYSIPKYQREYTWTQTQWQYLFDDIIENPKGYFLGSLICINNSDNTFNQALQVIDGQQRLTTLSILMAAICKVLNGFKLNEEQKLKWYSLKKKVVFGDNNNKLRVVPQTQGYNLDDYEYILKESELLTNAQRPTNCGNRRLMKAFRYFQNRIDNYRPTGTPDEACITNEMKIKNIFEIVDKINGAILVKIEVASHSDAYTLFESLNNRGTPLTAIDLMKNSLLSKAERAGVDIESYFESWKEIIENLGDDYADQERFFRYYYNAFREEIKREFALTRSKALVTVATRSNMLNIYDELIKNNSKKFLDDVLEGTKYYSMFLLNENIDGFRSYKNELINLRNSQGAPAYLLLLYIFKNKEKLRLDTLKINKIILFLSKFFVRRNMTDKPNTSALTSIFMSIIDELRKNTLDVFELISKTLIDKSATDDEFETALRGDIYTDNVGMTRYILCSLAQKNMTNENRMNLWRYQENKKKDIYVWTIEHIFPQGENIKPYWVNMIADGNKTLAKQHQEEYVHKIGNLTISGYNNELSDKDFISKRDRKNTEGFVGYKNGLSLNEDLKDLKAWTVDDIKARSEKLIKEAMKLFKLK